MGMPAHRFRDKLLAPRVEQEAKAFDGEESRPGRSTRGRHHMIWMLVQVQSGLAVDAETFTVDLAYLDLPFNSQRDYIR